MRRESFLKLMVLAPLAVLFGQKKDETAEKASDIPVSSIVEVDAVQGELNRQLQEKQWLHARRYSMSPEQFRRALSVRDTA